MVWSEDFHPEKYRALAQILVEQYASGAGANAYYHPLLLNFGVFFSLILYLRAASFLFFARILSFSSFVR